ncbi:hypothetical protein JQ582_03660 [Bradyrhizobium japonicum]|uniref:Transposase n=1 Tax=Bradyrhizobium japonicum TaxID=375 RepID=A0ABV2RYR3_BRAJP|nr:hypothetical protein [Bradyrhizobium japonicum]MBR0728388.1 hypothetical protein [Bradyrhizobium japonicum]MBR0743006.1 hypothetical protein [Bradyrhizobium japonicum]MBR0760613.1 hypothetical protein [Bradyrhizobium japonicum]MBR0802666.1 hypothetical protein [Bradyrhizobium japonicum]MBR0910543.1 hypothetical protein [Bradyrhizobium japonicum]
MDEETLQFYRGNAWPMQTGRKRRRHDNLGKGASGAAVQNMRLMLGLPEE